MQRILIPVFILLLLILSTQAAQAKQDGWSGNINIFLGAKALDDDDWAPADEHSEIGIELDFRPKIWPVNIAIDYLASESDKEPFLDPFSLSVFDAEAETSELNIGVRKIWEEYPNKSYNPKNSSIVMPASRIIARTVPLGIVPG